MAWRDAYVCVSVLGRKPTPSKPDNGIATPTPIQPGMVDNCNKFYKVASGDNCAGIASKQNILVKEFVTWNPKIGGESVCVSVIGYKPRPRILTQPSIVQPCSKLHKAVAGDTCQSIVKQYGDLDLATL
ncbi:carbohydrate-binding module family 50 protein [Metarhizium rileyi]|uniref:Carbohydrate-binding module family 50 protein n=1 Tax=Metarhizium rileyi (strain RCEF 4871) TaxID=1649241 RepID=A0A166VP85_METRR|nr:carbohydrate-binding module family 50 protein [Metarhizium rileyi RCEF 4871]